MSDAENEPVKAEEPKMNITVKDSSGKEIHYSVKATTKMSKIMKNYVSAQGLDVSSVRFLFDGERVGADDTPTSLGMDDNDQLDVVLEQTGGR
ncbi:hypothetical protein TeGR_g1229 [Tetraparma gracilis]|uniref:Ubiquitin-like domain-containing protein n=1 Tax=Tetraparma gracilis TaxID=2962635 RepID=A0ABQ6MKF6_9STRA|nr:hypothetical protein TeGR_g1229 [Tetraparma gracilis]